MTPEQCRMARAALKWSSTDLAESAGVTPATVNYFENGKDAYASTIEKLRAAFEASAAIEFSGDNGVFYLGKKLSND